MPCVISRVLRKGLLVGSAVLIASACETELAAGPDQLTDGIIIYEHAGFAGESAHLTGDVDDLSYYTGPCYHYSAGGAGYSSSSTYDWNDCISSIRVRRQ
jgi:hypothetical protein